MTFRVYPWRFCFVARDLIYFPPGQAGNILRGALGKTLLKSSTGRSEYARIFDPSSGDGPSGLSDLPRPFVLRASHLDGRTLHRNEKFHVDVHVFDRNDPGLDMFTSAFAQMAREGLGPGGGRAELDVSGSHTRKPVEIPMTWDGAPVKRIRVRFITPTELKSGSQIVKRPEFGTLFARARDRVSTLRALYGGGPLELNFRAIGERASLVEMIRCEIRPIDVIRRSSRTGQVHSIGGFIGEAEYAGDLNEFMPVLQAAQWTGVGRHTVWGNGAIEVTISNGGGINSKP